MKSQKDKDSPKNQKGYDSMMNDSVSAYNEARDALRAAKQILRDTRMVVRDILVRNLPSSHSPETAAQIGKSYGMDSHDVANLLRPYRLGKKNVTNVYVQYDPETGEVDFNRRVVKSYRVNVYGKWD